MKYLPPQTFQGKAQLFWQRYWIRLASTGIWFITIIFLAQLWSKRPPVEPQTTHCIVTKNAQKGEKLNRSDIQTVQVFAKNLPQNSIQDCGNAQLIEFPLLTDLQAGDLLQLSTFQKPNELISLKEQLAQKQQLFYLPIKDLHSYPVPLEIGQELTILGKAKKSEEAQVLIESITVADILVNSTEENQQQVSAVGFALQQSSSLALTKALADGWFLVAVSK